MALYFNGSAKLLNLNGRAYQVNLITKPLDLNLNDITLLSAEGYVLRDCNGLYLIAPRISGDVVEMPTVSVDGYILKDKKGVYLSNQEVE